MSNYKHSEITDGIINAFYKVYNHLGYGFLEKVYENSMLIQLREDGFKVERQKSIKVYYHEKEVGDYYADLIVNNLIIVELKAAEILIEAHEIQLINYLKATNIEVGLLLNFGKTPTVRRKVFSQDLKQS